MKCYNELLSLALDPFNNQKEEIFKKNYNVNSSSEIVILLQTLTLLQNNSHKLKRDGGNIALMRLSW